ncbi:MAG: DUF512 domain-containing protein, partial [Lachnospiraceae bacterium]|nr:DUF512 domain-containing protein [Lachnospiraceae bacterium]
GLVTGGDLRDQLKGNLLGDRLLLPIVMLRDKQNVFLSLFAKHLPMKLSKCLRKEYEFYVYIQSGNMWSKY